MFTVREVQSDPFNKLRRKITDLNQELTELNRQIGWLYVLGLMTHLTFAPIYSGNDTFRVLYEREAAVKRDISSYTTQLRELEKKQAGTLGREISVGKPTNN